MSERAGIYTAVGSKEMGGINGLHTPRERFRIDFRI